MNSMWEQFKQELIEEAREQGLEQGMEQGIMQGIAQGIAQGRVQGIEQGRVQGIEQGRETERLSSIRRLMTELQLTVEKAMDVLAIPQSEWARYKAML